MRSPFDVSPENAAYLDDLYDQYVANPDSVDPSLQVLFGEEVPEESAMVRAGELLPGATGALPSPVLGVFGLVQSYRELGHLIANLDPLGSNASDHPLLALSEFSFDDSDLDRVVKCGNFKGLETATLRELIAALRLTYCGNMGVEYTDIAEKEQRAWLEERMERNFNQPGLTPDEQTTVLTKLIAAEGLEQFLQAKYTTQKRFSLEGGESLIPLLDTMIESLGATGVQEIVLGVAHRGRLNVLANILGKPVEMILTEFEGTLLPADIVGDGDVKYHLGYSRDYTTREGHAVHLSLSPNPSHLEMVNPVIEGIVRAKQEHLGDRDRKHVVPVLVHGDAAFCGEGIVPETLALSELTHFRTGGTIHIILNNQIGFTTSPAQYRFTPYATEIAKMIRVPIFHVNGDDPEAVVHATRLAVGFRQTFKKDVIIDVVCYRRHGHNELDDPTFTQPALYQKIAAHPTTRRQYEERLIDAGTISVEGAKRIAAEQREVYDAALEYSRDFMPRQQVFAFGGLWKGLSWAHEDWSAHTAVDESALRKVATAYATTPPDFEMQARLRRLMDARAKMVLEDGPIDWGCGEALAFGSLLLEGTRVRLSGQDSGRGTFSHRHAIWRDARSDAPYVPLNHLDPKQAPCEIIDSPLSEAAVLGFEYGMSSADPHRLVLWEAQFGDFANVAQVFIDQFISSAESKWQRMSGIVLLLPHGYEGQGPEHSSARLERFLQLSADNNMQVCNLTTPAQFFHALRRQIHRHFRKPLVIMTPKSLLRHPMAVSRLSDFTEGEFHNVLDDPAPLDRQRVHRVLLCSGRIYYSLLEARRERDVDDIAIVRAEQLYPLPRQEILDVLGGYPAVRDVRWVQEEPWNTGAWHFMLARLAPALAENYKLTYVGRDEGASPATGLAKQHQREEAEMLNTAFARIAPRRRVSRPAAGVARAGGDR